MANEPKFGMTDGTHGIDLLAGSLYSNVSLLCSSLQISPMELCVAMANVQGWILADSQDMPQAEAMKQTKHLREVSKRAYIDHKHGRKKGGHA